MSTVTEPAVKRETVIIRDVGPHTSLEINVCPGVTVLRGKNECGKSIAIRCVAALAGADAKDLPIRDGARSGLIEGFGTTLVLSTRNTRTGDSEVDSLEDRMNLAELVDPGLKDPKAATRRRIRALLSLTKTDLEWTDFVSVLPEECQHVINGDLAHEDPVEMAGRIKRHLEKQARHYEDLGEAEKRKADVKAAQISGVDLEQPDDETELRVQLQDAIGRKAEIDQQLKAHEVAAARVSDAQLQLADYRARQAGLTLEQAQLQLDEKAQELAVAELRKQEAQQKLLEAQRQLEAAGLAVLGARSRVESAESVVEIAEEREEAMHGWQALIEAGIPERPSDEEAIEAQAAVVTAERAVVAGAKVREAKALKTNLERLRAGQLEQFKLAVIFREAAKATDDVLTSAVKSSVFRIEGGELQAQDGKGVWRPYGRPHLSDSALWTAAIRAVSEHVDSDKLVVAPLDQQAWEGCGAAKRAAIAQAALEHGVAIVTAEAGEDQEELQAYRWEVSA